MGEDQGGPRADVRFQFVAPQVAVGLIGDHDGDDVGGGGGLARGQDRESVGPGLCPGRRAGLQAHDDVGHARIAQVQRMGPPLAAVTDHGHALAANDRKIAVAVMEDGQRIG